MNTAIDWNSCPVRYPQFDPDTPHTDEIRAYREAEYLEAWMEGELVEAAGQDLYQAPVVRLLEDDGIERLGVMLDHMKAGRDEALLCATRSLLAKLEDQIRADAA